MIVGLDMGGTHIDAVLIHQGEIIDVVKKPTDHTNLQGLVWETLKDLLKGKDKTRIERINLSTTVSTNAIIMDKVDPVGMIIESGPGLPNGFLSCGRENIFIDGYIDHGGKEVKPFDPEEIKRAITIFKRAGINSAAVVTKFSVRNPDHEKDIGQLLKGDFHPITLGHTLSGKLNFPRRVFTAYYNSAIYKTFQSFSDSMSKALLTEDIKAPVYILKADGGAVSLEMGKNHPVETILSGPAASIMGTLVSYPTKKDAIFMDIGGTTTDISFLADGVPLFEPLGIKIGKYPTLVRALYNVSLGVGGDSSISIVDNSIAIGPRRNGPPRALGGPSPTPTDAMVVLGLMEIGDKEKAFSAIKDIGEQLDIETVDMAKKIIVTMAGIINQKVTELLREINSHPVYTVKELLYGKKIEPNAVYIIGGPAEAISPFLESEFKIPCHFPETYKVANAVGAALSKITTEITMHVDTVRQSLAVPEMGIHEKIRRVYDIKRYRQRAIDLLKERAMALGAAEDEIVHEIIEESSFNMVRDFHSRGKNIRIKVQTKPGLMKDLGGVNSAQS